MIIRSDAVHVWKNDIQAYASKYWELIKILSHDEIARAQRFGGQNSREQYVITRGYLRIILSRYLDLPPGEIHFTRDANGKPSIDKEQCNTNLQFSVSHSKDMAIYAITKNSSVGVDVEYITSKRDVSIISERFFHPAEINALKSASPKEQLELFFRYWVRKEALGKACGTGITEKALRINTANIPFTSSKFVDVSQYTDEDIFSSYVLADFIPGENYMASLVSRHEIRSIEYQDLASISK